VSLDIAALAEQYLQHQLLDSRHADIDCQRRLAFAQFRGTEVERLAVGQQVEARRPLPACFRIEADQGLEALVGAGQVVSDAAVAVQAQAAGVG